MVNFSQRHRHKPLLRGLVVLILISLYYKMSLRNFSWYHFASKHPCVTPKREMRELLSLAEESHEVLNTLGVPHFLVYGSLFGGLRENAPLKWDNDFDFGVVHNDINKYSENDINRAFKERGIQSSYNYRGGFYRLTNGSARGDIMVFKDFYNNGWMHRVGLESYVFFINYRYTHMFPAYLVEPPMPTVRFGSKDISVPHGGMEILKYHYPDDWWLVKKPLGCL